MSQPRVVCVVGPTAAGKTTLALDLAERLGGEIVSADSRQVYRGLDVGTAKPTMAERARVPHHCLDLVEPSEVFDAARFQAAATAAIADITTRGRVALVVGGTGLWLRALLRGLCPAPARVPALRAELEALRAREGPGALHARLAAVDPTTAARLHPNDMVRVIRALEVTLTSGRPLSHWQAAHRFAESPFEAFLVGLAVEPTILARRIASRVDAMLAGGWCDEVRRLVDRGLPDEAPAWRTLGYRELRAVVRGEVALDEIRPAITRATVRFAARQRLWFRREPGIRWYQSGDELGRLQDDVAGFLTSPSP